MASSKKWKKNLLGFLIIIIGLVVILSGVYLFKKGYIQNFLGRAYISPNQELIGKLVRKDDPSCKDMVLGEKIAFTPSSPTPYRPTPTPICKTGVNSFSVDTSCETNGFRYMTFKCYDGYGGREGGPTSCKTSETWRSYAEKNCMGRSNCQTPTPTPTFRPTPTPISIPNYPYKLKVESWGQINIDKKELNKCLYVQISSKLKPESFVNKKVKVTGVLKSNVFYVISIEEYKPVPTRKPLSTPIPTRRPV